MKGGVPKLTPSIWLLTVLAVVGLLLATVASAFSSAANLFAHEEQNQASIAYDGGSLSAFNYDSATVRVADEKEIQTVGPGGFFADFTEFLAAKTGIGVTGQIGENALKQLGGESQVVFNTSQGGRYVDQLVGGIANESKVGYQSLTPSMRLQVMKDVELMGTASNNLDAAQLFRDFSRLITGDFRKHRDYFVGPDALKMQKEGVRLITMHIDEAKEYDLDFL